ncbi:MAG: helix-turn-helix domain-containing protein [Porcipelethomonas sp.]
MKFSEKVRNLRIQSGMSQEGLAEKLDVSRQTVSKWESGGSFPEIEKLIALSDLFDVSIDYLLRDKQINSIAYSKSLDRMVIQFLSSSNDMADISRQLVDIAEDGIIDDKEKTQLENIICNMDRIAENIETIRRAINDVCIADKDIISK